MWRLVEEQRFATVRHLERLTDAEWAAPSLCAGWTVRDVAGHLLLFAETSPTERVWAAIRYSGHDRATDRLSRRLAERPIEQLTASLRAAVGDQSLPPGARPHLALEEAVVHALDIWAALHKPIEPAPEALVAVLDELVRERNPYPGRHLVATDAAWHHGQAVQGEVRGPASALVLALTGRTAARAALDVR